MALTRASNQMIVAFETFRTTPTRSQNVAAYWADLCCFSDARKSIVTIRIQIGWSVASNFILLEPNQNCFGEQWNSLGSQHCSSAAIPLALFCRFNFGHTAIATAR